MLVELTPETRERAGAYYSPHLAESERLFNRYTREQMELLLEFVRTGREFNEREADALERANRERPSPPPAA